MYRFLKTVHSDKIEAYRIQDEYARQEAIGHWRCIANVMDTTG